MPVLQFVAAWILRRDAAWKCVDVPSQCPECAFPAVQRVPEKQLIRSELHRTFYILEEMRPYSTEGLTCQFASLYQYLYQ